MPDASQLGRRRGWWVVASVVLVGVQCWALYLPEAAGVPGVDLPIPFLDKIVHLGLFALPTLALARWMPVCGAAALMVLQAVASEIVQATVLPQRSGDPLDAVADLIGIALGAWAAQAVGRPRPRVSPGARHL